MTHVFEDKSIKTYSYNGLELFNVHFGIKNIHVANGSNILNFGSYYDFFKKEKEKKIFYVLNCTDFNHENITNVSNVISSFIEENNFYKPIKNKFLDKLNFIFKNNEKNGSIENIVTRNIVDGKKVIFDDTDAKFINADQLKFHLPYPVDAFLNIGDELFINVLDSLKPFIVKSKSVTSFSVTGHEYLCYVLLDIEEETETHVYINEHLEMYELCFLKNLFSNLNYFSNSVVDYVKRQYELEKKY